MKNYRIHCAAFPLLSDRVKLESSLSFARKMSMFEPAKKAYVTEIATGNVIAIFVDGEVMS